MKPLIILLTSFCVAAIAVKLSANEWNFPLSGRIALAIMLAFTAMGHFLYAEGMAMMLPVSIPFRKEVIYLTGVLEIFGAICLLIPGWELVTGWALILFFLALLPANIYAAIHQVNYEKPQQKGPGVKYLWFRVPLQMLFIAWTYFSAIHHWH